MGYLPFKGSPGILPGAILGSELRPYDTVIFTDADYAID
jgi:hypothetical protein